LNHDNYKGRQIQSWFCTSKIEPEILTTERYLLVSREEIEVGFTVENHLLSKLHYAQLV